MIRLGVNIDHIATLRQARRGHEPDTATAAGMAFLGGANGITIHLREDRRHIQDRDVALLRQTVPFGLNLEMACSDEIVAIAVRTKPDQVTLVPEKREELTTEGGLDVCTHRQIVQSAVEQLHAAKIDVALFIDPDRKQIDAAKALHVSAIEFQTGSYAEAKTRADVTTQLTQLRTATDHALTMGLHVHMGHGLNYVNVQAIAAIAGVEELNIGHAIVSRAVFVGLTQAVRDMRDAIDRR